jgi:hypothetical protein
MRLVLGSWLGSFPADFKATGEIALHTPLYHLRTAKQRHDLFDCYRSTSPGFLSKFHLLIEEFLRHFGCENVEHDNYTQPREK